MRLVRINWRGFGRTRHWLTGPALISWLLRTPKDLGGTGFLQRIVDEVYSTPTFLGGGR